MARIGTNIAYGGKVPVELLAELGVAVVRVVAHQTAEDFGYFDQLKRRKVDIILTFARECFDGFGEMEVRSGFPTPETQVAAFREYLRRYGGHIYAWQIGNEPDAEAGSLSSWIMPHSYLNGMLLRARETLGANKYIIGPGLCSGNPDWIRGMDLRLVNAIAIHPYGQGTPDFPSPFGFDGNIAVLLDRYQAVLNDMGESAKHKHVTEFGGQSSELGEKGQADYVQALGRWFRQTDKVGDAVQFCVSDWMVPSFGITKNDDAWTRKPAFQCLKPG